MDVHWRKSAELERLPAGKGRLGPEEAAFLAERDSFFLASFGEGWPYAKHQGGGKGFLAVIDDRTIAFPDPRGTRLKDDWVILILVDYQWRQCLRILGHARTHIASAGRIVVVHIDAVDWNCILPRFTVADMQAALPSIEQVASR